MDAYSRVRTARQTARPTAYDYISSCFSSFMELHGDRCYGDDRAIIGGIAMLDDMPVTAIGIEKGHTAAERVEHSFGSPEPEGYRKALRLMRQAAKFRRPVITFVDTAGAYCGIGAEERGQGAAIAESLMEMMELPVPAIAVLIGEGGSGGALALAVADRVWMLENAVYSVISPEGCASILYKDPAMADIAAENLRLTAADAISLGVCERVISEEGIGTDAFYGRLAAELAGEIRRLAAEDDLPGRRYKRFRAFGSGDE